VQRFDKLMVNQLCRGKIADFIKIEDSGGFFNPKEDSEWPKNRILSPAFLKTILLREPYLGALPRDGVRIIGGMVQRTFFPRICNSLSHAMLG